MRTIKLMIMVIFGILTACKKERIETGNISGGNAQGSGNTAPVNKLPIANAGPDRKPGAYSCSLDGSASNDPDGNITRWLWRKISGPNYATVTINGADQPQANVSADWGGIFHFELQVTDNGGLVAKDSVYVFFFAPSYYCDTSLRPVIESRLTTFWQFPFERFGVGVMTSGNKVYFAGGRESGSGNPTAQVAILDMITKEESHANLSIPRAFIGCISAGSKLFFAGGWTWAGALSRVEIVDLTAGTSKVAELSVARWGVATAVLGNKVFFAGGSYFSSGTKVSSRIDIYDMTTDTWSVSELSEARSDISAVVDNGKIYFAGGNKITSVSDAIDVYDGQMNLWSVSRLNNAIANTASVSVNNKIYWAGGYNVTVNSAGNPQSHSKCEVQIKDIASSSYSMASLFARSSSSIACHKNNTIIYFPASESPSWFFDVYDLVDNSWSIGVINESLRGGVRFVYNNDIYLAGGYFGSTQVGNVIINNKILKLEF